MNEMVEVKRGDRAAIETLLVRAAPEREPTPMPNLAVLLDAETGDPVAAVGRYRGDMGALRRAFMAYPMSTTKRAAGIRNNSAVFGNVSRRVHMKREGCRACGGAGEAPGAHQGIVAAGEHLTNEFMELLPMVAAADRDTARAIAPDWLIPGTPWTSGVLNDTSPLPYHYDRNNLTPIWSAMVTARRNVAGGHLHIPELDLTLECRDGDVIYFPGWHFMHGVTPMHRTAPDGYRFTAVFYAVAGMADCLPPAEETTRARRNRSLREDTLLDRQIDNGLRDETTGANLEADLLAFARLQLASTDIDPVYPVLDLLEEDFDEEAALIYTLRYVTFYDLAAALRHEAGEYFPLPGNERRSLRDKAKMNEHRASVEACIDRYGSATAWLRPPTGTDPAEGWAHVRARYEQAKHNGRWASYKLAEICATVHRWPITAPDMGNDQSSGPLQGLNLVLGTNLVWRKADIAEADRLADALLGRMRDHLPALRIEHLETLLCDFHALHDGRYYPGIDIDTMQEQIATLPPEQAQRLLHARSDAIPHEWLGELTGRPGVDKARKRAYADTGQILGRP